MGSRDMEKHPYDELIEIVADKMKEHEDDNLGFRIFEKVDKDLGLSRGTAWDASGWKDYCDFGNLAWHTFMSRAVD
jgi:hypothetical protein